MHPLLPINEFLPRRFKPGTKESSCSLVSSQKRETGTDGLKKARVVSHNGQEFRRRVVESSACGAFVNGFTHSSSQTIPAFLDFFSPFLSAATLASLSHKDTQTNTHQHTHTHSFLSSSTLGQSFLFSPPRWVDLWWRI